MTRGSRGGDRRERALALVVALCAALAAELAASAARFELVTRAPALAAKPVLLVAGARDTDAPPAQHHVPLASALREAGAARFDEWVIDADHAFSDHRIALARAVTGWLADHCR